jgi:hypothetical protein
VRAHVAVTARSTIGGGARALAREDARADARRRTDTERIAVEAARPSRCRERQSDALLRRRIATDRVGKVTPFLRGAARTNRAANGRDALGCAIRADQAATARLVHARITDCGHGAARSTCGRRSTRAEGARALRIFAARSAGRQHARRRIARCAEVAREHIATRDRAKRRGTCRSFRRRRARARSAQRWDASESEAFFAFRNATVGNAESERRAAFELRAEGGCKFRTRARGGDRRRSARVAGTSAGSTSSVSAATSARVSAATSARVSAATSARVSAGSTSSVSAATSTGVSATTGCRCRSVRTCGRGRCTRNVGR